MGVAQEFLGRAACPWRSKQWTPSIVDAMQQDEQEQAVVHVVDVEQRGQADSLNRMAVWNPCARGNADVRSASARSNQRLHEAPGCQ